MQDDFEPAVKTACKARMSLEGPGGAGKTFTALTLAQAWAAIEGGRVCVIDTKNGQSKLYSDLFDFEVKVLRSFHPDALVEWMIKAARFAVCIVDSASPFWSGRDGILEQVDRIGSSDRAGQWGGGWKRVKPMENRMLDALSGFPGHLICTFQLKTDWVVQTDREGKMQPVKIGLKPDQRNEMEYEFDLVGTLDRDHQMRITKTRFPELDLTEWDQPGHEFATHFHDLLTRNTAKADPAMTADGLRDEALANYHTSASMMDLWKRAGRLGLLHVGVVDATGERVALGQMIKDLGLELRTIEKSGGTQQ